MAAAGECFRGGEIYGRAAAGRRRRSDCGGDWLLGICQARCGLAEAGVAFHAMNHPAPEQSECLPTRQVCLLRAISRSAGANTPPAQPVSILPNQFFREFLSPFGAKSVSFPQEFHVLRRRIL